MNMTENCSSIAKNKEHPYQAIGCCIVFPILVVCTMIALPVIWLMIPRYIGTKRPRATIIYMAGCFRFCNDGADKYYEKNGYFPPKLDGNSFYGPMTEIFGKTIPINIPLDFAQGSIVDPHCDKALFPNTKKATALFYSPRNPDGWVKLKGYPPRYFRSKNGQWAIFIGNGPDEQATLTKEILDSIDEKISDISYLSLSSNLGPYTYDPSNGTWSAGDKWRITELPLVKLRRR